MRTVTYSGTEVQWATLTMSSPASASNLAQPTGDDPVETINPSDTAWYFPAATSTSWADGKSHSGSPMVTTGFAMMVAALMI